MPVKNYCKAEVSHGGRCSRIGSVEEPAEVDRFDLASMTIRKVANGEAGSYYCRQHSTSLWLERLSADSLRDHLAARSNFADRQLVNTKIVQAVSLLKATCTDEASAEALRLVLEHLDWSAARAVGEADRG